MSTARVIVQRTPQELLDTMPEAGAFTCFHRSSQGTNFYERGDDKEALITRVVNFAHEHNMLANRVVDETKGSE